MHTCLESEQKGGEGGREQLRCRESKSGEGKGRNKGEITSMIIDQGMFHVQLGTILGTDPVSMIQQTIFHR